MAESSITLRLHEQLSQIITATEAGGRLPPEPELAKSLGVSRATLREAMRIFETQGFIRRRQGSGTFVNHPARTLESGLEILESIETIAERNNLLVTMGELDVERRLATPDEISKLSLDDSKEVIQISRVILAENRPVAFLVDILPVHILTPEELTSKFSGSVLDLLINRGDPQLLSSRTEINAKTANSSVARALGVQRGVVLIYLIADLYSTAGNVIDHSYSYFLPGYFHFHVVRKVG